MVARSYLLSLLAVVATVGTTVLAVPQNGESQPPASALESVPVDIPAPPQDAKPVPGAESNTLLAAAPDLERLVNDAPKLENGQVTKRDVGLLEKRAVCRPGVHWYTWNYFVQKMCNGFFPNPRLAYYVQEGRCLTGSVPARRPYIPYKLNYRCCAKQCGAHVSFVGVTNAVCTASFRKAISYGIRQCGAVIRSSDNRPDTRDPLVCSFWAS